MTRSFLFATFALVMTALLSAQPAAAKKITRLHTGFVNRT